MKTGYQTAILALCACLVTPLANAVVHYQVVPGNNPPVTLQADQKALLYIPAQDQQSLQLVIPELGINQTITPAQQNTYFINALNVPERELTYMIKTQDGQNVASGKLLNYMPPTVASMDLNSLINYSTAYSYDKKPEPQYNDASTAQAPTPADNTPNETTGKTYMRGYW